jgi:cytochrome c oxidase subunit 4
MIMDHAEHHHHGPDHVPHISPLSLYLKTFGTLMVLTVITVGVSYVDLGTAVNLVIALIIATVKATVVAAFFMHLASDHKFHAVTFASSLVFLIIFVSFTMFDTSSRGSHDPSKKNRPLDMKDPFAVSSAPVPVIPAGAPVTATATAATTATASASATVAASASASAETSASAEASASVSADASASASVSASAGAVESAAPSATVSASAGPSVPAPVPPPP